MKKGLANIQLKDKISLLSIISIVASLLILMMVSINVVNNGVNKLIHTNINNEVKSLSAYLDTWMLSQIGNLEGLVDSISAIENISDEDALKLLNMYFEKYEGNEYYGGYEDGKYLDASGWEPPSDYDPRKRDWYIDTFGKVEVQISDPYVDAEYGDIIVSISKSIFHKNGEPIGVLSSDIRLNHFVEALKLYELGDKSYAILADNNENILVHANQDYLPSEEKSLAIKEILREEEIIDSDSSEKLQYQVDYDGEKRAYIGDNMETTGWYVILAKPESSVKDITSPLLIRLGFAAILLIIIFSIIAQVIGRIVARPILNIKEMAEKLSELDMKGIELEENIQKDETGQLLQAFSTMTIKLRNVVESLSGTSNNLKSQSGNLVQSVKQISKASDEIAISTDDISNGVMEQAKTVQLGITEVSELSNSIDKSVENSRELIEANRLIKDRIFIGKEGLDKLNKISDENGLEIEKISSIIGETNQSALEINEISEVIAGIASQTKLLALNAAIEAASAGELGRGFAIVADEVRALAEESNKSVSHINKVIKILQENTNKASQSMEILNNAYKIQSVQTKNNKSEYEEIEEAVGVSWELIENLITTNENMTKNKEIIITSFENLSAISEENSTSTEEVSATMQEQSYLLKEVLTYIEELDKLSSGLNEVIRQFKL